MDWIFLYMYYAREEQEKKSIHGYDMANSSAIGGTVACDIAGLILRDGYIEAFTAWSLAYVPMFVV